MTAPRTLALLLPLVVLAGLAWLTFSGELEDGGPGTALTGGPGVERAGEPGDSALLAPESRTGGESGTSANAGTDRKPGRAVNGIVLSEPGREPVAGCEARLWTPAGIVQTSTTEADGRFALALPSFSDSEEPLEAWVQVAPAIGWTIREEPVEIPEEGEAGAELVFHAAREGARSPLHLTVVDAASGDPVPHYAVSLFASGGLSELATSDAKGAIDSDVAFPAGEVLYTEVDLGLANRNAHQHRFAHDGHASEGERRPLPVHVGPTYLISVDLPEGTAPDRFYARVAPEAYAYRGVEQIHNTAPLRGGDPLWARFGPFPYRWFYTNGRTGPYRLEVHDVQQRWFGGAPVLTVEGMHPGVVRIELTPLSNLAGRVFDEAGELVEGADARLDSAHGDSGGWSFAAQTTGVNGAFLFKGVAPGAYLLRARTRARGLGEAPLVFGGGRDVTRDVVLRSVPTGAVSGRVVSRTGAYRGRPWLFLEPRGEALAGMGMRTRVQFESESASALGGEFDFGELPIGEYELSIDDGHSVFEPERMVVTPPAERLQITCLDDVTVMDLGFEARDARTGAAPSSLYLRFRSGTEVEEGLIDGEDPYGPSVRDDRPFAWWLLAAGYRPASGDLSAFHEELDAPWFGARVARVALRPGWGRIVRVEDESGSALAGAAIFLDGEKVAETGTDGCVVVGAEEDPETWTATHGTLVEVTSTQSEWEIRLVLGAGGLEGTGH